MKDVFMKTRLELKTDNAMLEREIEFLRNKIKIIQEQQYTIMKANHDALKRAYDKGYNEAKKENDNR